MANGAPVPKLPCGPRSIHSALLISAKFPPPKKPEARRGVVDDDEGQEAEKCCCGSQFFMMYHRQTECEGRDLFKTGKAEGR